MTPVVAVAPPPHAQADPHRLLEVRDVDDVPDVVRHERLTPVRPPTHALDEH